MFRPAHSVPIFISQISTESIFLHPHLRSYVVAEADVIIRSKIPEKHNKAVKIDVSGVWLRWFYSRCLVGYLTVQTR